MLILGAANTNLEEVLGFLAVLLGTLNVVGGFVVTTGCSRCSSPSPRRLQRALTRWLDES